MKKFFSGMFLKRDPGDSTETVVSTTPTELMLDTLTTPSPELQPEPEQITPPKVRLLYNYDIGRTFIYGGKAFLATPSERKKRFLEQYKSVNSKEIKKLEKLEKLRTKMMDSGLEELFYIWLSISLDILYTDWPGKEYKYKSITPIDKEYNDFKSELNLVYNIIRVLRGDYNYENPETYYKTKEDEEDTEKQQRFKNTIEKLFGIEIILFEGDNIFSLDDVILITRSLLYKLKRLKKIQTQLKIEKNQELIISSFKPAIFWKDKDVIKQQLKVLTLSEINKFIKDICNLELTIKQNSNRFKVLINNFLIEQSKQINN